jgi:DNA uptake protein ComE-like DNA-binding protein
MRNKIIRDYYLLPRWEQKAILWISLILLFSAAARLAVETIPPGEPPGVDEFLEEARMMADSLRAETLQQIDLNRADSSALLPLPGIGPVFASRIIKYRELLGGYVSHDQLKEVYGLPEETVRMMRDRVFIDTLAIRKIDLETASFRQLLRHPYLEYEQVKALLRYREWMGGFQSFNDLIDNALISDSALMKIAPYLQWDSSPSERSEPER